MSELLKLTNISYQVNQQEILQNISFTLNNNDYLTLTGPSGSGKSTLLQLIANLLTPTSGKIAFHKSNIATMDPISYRKKVSYCAQQPTLFGNTVLDNFSFPYQIRKKSFDMEKAKASLRRISLPENYLSKKITELSGGERQRIALIRNLLFLPEILLLDEVTAELDDESKQVIHQLIDELNKEEKFAIIYVTHDSQEINSAKNLKKIVAGKLEE
ncbi:putative ABC transporter ATP-binding protein YbbL [Melissococcus plutonius]|uniref:ABC transporter ATP-binding protein n=1 Tax=Melissococcus plutonius TaxID=33970 RepID=UPI00065E042C|nr:ATP-binding cassette domain-containing protein [Melissococcus plutonius]AIM25681.1 putative ABC transporter ATP-binding protein YbbL [Melissococcus plutonius S1]KMT24953.1 putative ABC transporter ATP-binding protein YbbL [Melissococcus plutonius]KMT26590.1 putative ABC transporter ATP-binding protein YbbL [Melissococcus plutonius]KMT27840.1 putative ABC transporter ATP-binding protein YbbL [Melissococcus plutonius]KMT29612.1 putative ABC transporter ATP-binding protein YbbL [Melissococcus 